MPVAKPNVVDFESIAWRIAECLSTVEQPIADICEDANCGSLAFAYWIHHIAKTWEVPILVIELDGVKHLSTTTEGLKRIRSLKV